MNLHQKLSLKSLVSKNKQERREADISLILSNAIIMQAVQKGGYTILETNRT